MPQITITNLVTDPLPIANSQENQNEHAKILADYARRGFKLVAVVPIGGPEHSLVRFYLRKEEQDSWAVAEPLPDPDSAYDPSVHSPPMIYDAPPSDGGGH